MKNSFNENLNIRFNSKMRFEISAAETRVLIKQFLAAMDDELCNGREVYFKGAFRMQQVTRLTAHGNPRTMTPVPPRPRKKVKVKFSKNFGGAGIVNNEK